MSNLKLKNDFYWNGSLDPELRVFDIIMETEYGTSYNSYLLKGSEKTVLFETSKAKCMEDYIAELEEIVAIKDIDYIVVSHTEPDHAGTAAKLIEMNPAIKLVGTGTAMRFMKEITNSDFTQLVVKDGDTLSLGDKTLEFFTAANLHWPDAMYTYVKEDKVLVTCDSFGCHYSFPEILISKLKDKEGYEDALKYYFDNIMGPFKPFVLKAIDKIKDLEIDMICPGHGPVIDEDPWKLINTYKVWATENNPNQKKTVVIPYVSAYGYTKSLGEKITEGIKAAGDIEVKAFDMVEADPGKVAEEIYWADGLLFGTPTIIGDALKPIWDLSTNLFAPVHGGKIASAFGSFGWSGEGVPNMIERLKQLRMKVYGDGFKVPFKPSEVQLESAYEFGYGFGLSVAKGKITEPEKVFTGKRYWKCLVCGEIVEGPNPPETCPVCGVGPEQFVEVEVDEVTYSSNAAEKFLVLGGGIAGLAAAEEIRKRNKVAEIKIISDEKVPCYNRPMLTKGILSEPDGISFFTKQYSWYEENNIKLMLATTVTSIDRDKKIVTMADGKSESYDKLIYALGAEGGRPPIPGAADRDNVFYIRKLADTDALRSQLDSGESVALIGGGVLGLEAAWECIRAGKKVSIIEISAGVMMNQLDQKGSEFLRAAAEKSGAAVYCGTGIKEIMKDKVVLEDGTEVPAQLLLISAGIKPVSSIGVDSGLVGGRWIEVDRTMKTSDDNIYAAGDVAIVDGVSIAIWSQALEMGKVAGINAVGDQGEYVNVTPSNAFSGFGIDLFAIGDNGKKPDLKYKEVEFFEKAKGIYKKMYFVNDKLVGGILMGAPELGPKLLEAYEKSMSFKDAVSIL